jgi:cytochrome c oxidase subunit 3
MRSTSTTTGATAHHAQVAHHFETAKQQFDTGKLGMWVFLATEILMFGGLFCAYSVYRANHPDVFRYAHHYLDTMLGGTNTVILIASSFTMAWAVRSAQLGNRTALKTCLALTLLGGAGFMTIKAVEYGKKWSTHKWVGTDNLFHPGFEGDATPTHHGSERESAEPEGHEETGAAEGLAQNANIRQGEPGKSTADPDSKTTEAAESEAPTGPEHSLIESPSPGPAGLASAFRKPRDADRGKHYEFGDTKVEFEDLPKPEQERVHIFFQIYYLMTGLHGLHVLVGMGLISWLLVRALAGAFGPSSFAPVDLIGLYWHLVDLMWILLFPLR